MSGVTTSSLSLAWSLRNWVILDYEEPNGLTVRPWAPFFLFFFLSSINRPLFYFFLVRPIDGREKEKEKERCSGSYRQAVRTINRYFQTKNLSHQAWPVITSELKKRKACDSISWAHRVMTSPSKKKKAKARSWQEEPNWLKPSWATLVLSFYQ